VDVVERVLDAGKGERVWEVTVRPLEEAKRLDKNEKEAKGRGEEKETEAARLLRAVEELQEGGEKGSAVGYTGARDLAKLSGANMQAAVNALVAAGEVEEVGLPKDGGGTKKGLRRVK
jgi:hypothetical protein